MTVGQRLRQLRQEQGFSLRQLEEQTGVCYSSIYKYECGICPPSIKALSQLAKALKTDVYELMDLVVQTDWSTK